MLIKTFQQLAQFAQILVFFHQINKPLASIPSLFKESNYKGKGFSYPSHDVDPSIKRNEKGGNAWYKRYFEAMYSDYLSDRCGIPYSSKYQFAINRAYGMGNQPTTKYMDILCPLEPGQSERKGYMNISYDIISVAPKFRRIFIGQFEKQEHDIIASAINDKALADKEDQKWMLWATAKLQPFLEMMDKKMGITSDPPEFLPETIPELEMFMQDGFKLPTEMSIEMGVDFAFYLSQWQETKKRMMGDAFDIGVMACQDYVDPVDKKIKVRYLDPANLIVRYSKDPMYQNIDHWGYIDQITISALRHEAPELSETELFQIAKGYSNYAQNSTLYDINNTFGVYPESFSRDNNGMYPYDNYVVDILRGEWISSDTEIFSMRTMDDGSVKTFKEPYSYSKKDNDKRKVKRNRYQMTYKGSWVIGTEFMFDCGKQYDIPRPDKKRPQLSLNIYKYSDKSICASIIPNLDSFQLAWLKLQNAQAMAAPSGLAIEIGTLENITIDGKTLTPMEILAIKRETGDYLYKLTTHHSELNNGNAGRAVTEIQGGIGAQLNEFVAIMDYNINIIRQQTGMNELVDASTPNPDQPVKTSQIAVQSSNNALQPIYSGYTYIKESAAKKIALRYQIQAANGDIKGYLPSLGSNVVQMFIITKDVAFEDYAIKIRLRPTDEMKAAVRNSTLKSVALGPLNGGISESDALYIEDKIQNGNLKLARLYLGYKEKKYAKDRERLQRENMELNGQNMQSQEQLKAQAEQQRLQLETESQMRLSDQAFNQKKEELTMQHTFKMEQIAATGQVKAEVDSGLIALKGMIDDDQKPEKELVQNK